jgi:translation initiation factor IF-2
MSKKRVHEIAKEQGLSSKELLEKLHAAGIEAKAAASSVEEAVALKALGQGATKRSASSNGAAKSAVADRPARATRPAAPSAGDGSASAPRRAASAASTAASGGSAPPAAPKGATPAAPRAGDAGQAAKTSAAAPGAASVPKPAEPAPGASRTNASRAVTPPAGAPRPGAPAASAPQSAAPRPSTPQGAGPRTGAPPASAPKASASAPAAPAAPPPPTATTPQGSAPAPAAERVRPTRDSRTGERTPGEVGPGGRRRVVIDSQASRRQQSGPSNQPQRRPRRGRRRRGTYDETIAPIDNSALEATDLIRVSSGSTVKDVAEYLGVAVPDVIKKLMSLGEMATLTQTLSDDAIQVLADEFEKQVEIIHAADDVDLEPIYEDAEEDLIERPPVVTIMGHVDHGKTSLLDAIRETEVVAGEAGGITQHIGAYQVHHSGKEITFLDTPGHEAFTAMRARGARVTDLAVIVVAADDGVKPQTEEAIDHAKAAEVPIVVAVNKVDKEGAQPERVRTEMTQHGLQPAEWGGDTEFVDVSAKTHVGLDSLLDTIQVVTDLEELRANRDTDASGTVIESKLDPGRGPVVTILIQRGTLRVGDALVAGAHFGRVRAMHDFTGGKLKRAMPGQPVEVLGFDGVPEAGEPVRVVENERRARQLAGERANRLKTEALARRSGRKVSLEDVFKLAQEGTVKELALVIKADVAGSLEAIEDEIAKLPQQEVKVNIIHRGVGGINESDVMLAAASDGVIMAFNVRPVGDARQIAEREGVEIRSYSVIYRAIEELRGAMEGMLEPAEVETPLGQAEVRQLFKASRIGTIAGCYVTEGTVARGSRVRLVRDGTVIYDTTIESLRRFNDDVREVNAGFECGIVLANFQDVHEGDLLETYETRRVERELSS